MKQRTVIILAIFLSSFIIFGLSKTIYGTYQSGRRLKVSEKETQQLLAENKLLREELSTYQSDEFIEKQAREKLNFVKPGETMVVIEGNQANTSDAETRNKELEDKLEAVLTSNLEKWRYLFWGNSSL